MLNSSEDILTILLTASSGMKLGGFIYASWEEIYRQWASFQLDSTHARLLLSCSPYASDPSDQEPQDSTHARLLLSCSLYAIL